MVTPPLQTGQMTCHDASGQLVPCAGAGQDASFSSGILWPEPRFVREGKGVLDHLTGLYW